MEPSTIVLYAGLLVVLVALAIWVFRKPEPNAQNTIRAFGIEFALNTPALAVMALGIVVIVIGLTSGPKASFEYRAARRSSANAVLRAAGRKTADDLPANRLRRRPRQIREPEGHVALRKISRSAGGQRTRLDPA